MTKLLTAFFAALTISTVCSAEELPETELIQETTEQTQEIFGEEAGCIIDEDFTEEPHEAAETILDDTGIEVMGIEEISTVTETEPAAASTVEVTDVLENHDVYVLRSIDNESDRMARMASILPGQVTAVLSDGSQVVASVTGAWENNPEEKYFKNSAVVPEGVTDNGLFADIRIRYITDYKANSLYFSGSKKEEMDTRFDIWKADDEDTFLVYKFDEAGVSTLKYSSSTSLVDKEGSRVTLIEPKSQISDSGKYFCISYNSAARNGSSDCYIYLALPYEDLYVDHAWYHTPDTREYVCQVCGIYYQQVYDWATGQRLEKQLTLEELKAKLAEERKPPETQKMPPSDEDEIGNKKETSLAKVIWKSAKKKKKSAVLKWKKTAGASYYEVYWRAGKKGKFKLLKKTKKLSYTRKKLKKGKTYYFKVRAVKKSGKQITYGKFSKAKKISF